MKDLLFKLIPGEDKLIHFYIGTILAIVLGFFINPFIVLLILVFAAFVYEIAREEIHYIKLDYWDIFYSILPAFLILISSIIG